ncbi:hypothetical protein OSB04_016449 [Centaurea solstitialis]|uniref:Expansin n=1 Tax=Centaurea solstitialis TaxID=347529 RepID=A0AA38T0Y8_9ASTR|nr:hypothetical protein OSB04_016448 [Centaurea solstitialis]KAJ9552404.1 hypothetical protein OSB04_016449 [Centaurea solstitialis]
MAFNLKNRTLIYVFITLVSSLFISRSSCLSPKLLNDTKGEGNFLPALGTWYGDPRGAGSGGACGWEDDVKSPPFSAMIAAGNAKIYLHGKGCGDCYQIKCSRKPFCSGKPITVTITDECPGKCNDVPFHFDLSGTAFGAMASPGQADNLRNLGQVNILYQRVLCNYGSTKIAFKTNKKANPFWFAAAIEFVEGVGEVQSVKIAQAGSNNFLPMHNSWGAMWEANISPSFRGPFSFQLTSPTRKTITAFNVVPSNFVPGKTYNSNVNF